MQEEYRVFFSRDCMMYGVEKLVVDNGSGRKMFWQQVLPRTYKNGSAYTYYKGVAERWLREVTA